MPKRNGKARSTVLFQSPFGTKPDGENQRACALKEGRSDYNFPNQRRHAVQLQISGRLHEQSSFMQTDPPVHEDREHRHDRHKAESADLDQKQNDKLSEKAPMRKRVDDDKPGHAGRARRGKEGIQNGVHSRCADEIGRHSKRAPARMTKRKLKVIIWV